MVCSPDIRSRLHGGIPKDWNRSCETTHVYRPQTMLAHDYITYKHTHIYIYIYLYKIHFNNYNI